MGLDMYLNKKTYIGNKHREGAALVKVLVPAEAEQQGAALPVKPEAIKNKRVQYIEEEIGYWRKANEIHQWFVENVQEGEDDCGEYEVSTEQLQELLDKVKAVLANPALAPHILPTQSGFFFGDTEYGENYIEDLKETEKILISALTEADSGTFYYTSSW